jgi:PIN domain nuclease of toxin-antitoxin system
VKLLLDTHTLLWLFSSDARLSKTAREVFLDEHNTLHFSIAGLWELTIKVSLGKLRLAENWMSALLEETRQNEITWLAITSAHCVKLAELPFHHRDPFDRMLVAQAFVENMVLVSRDKNFAKYGVRCIW